MDIFINHVLQMDIFINHVLQTRDLLPVYRYLSRYLSILPLSVIGFEKKISVLIIIIFFYLFFCHIHNYTEFNQQ